MNDSKTATERLREMLDERGVVHYDSITATGWRGMYGEEVLAISIREKSSEQIYMQHYPLTPEQAIAATLGNSDALLERLNQEVKR